MPEYTIRESVRAKHVRFKVSVADGLEVVIPKGFDPQRIPALLAGKKAWLMRALDQVEQQRQTMTKPDQHPESIALPTLDQIWRLEWLRTEAMELDVAENPLFVLKV